MSKVVIALLLVVVACDKKPRKQEIDVVWSPPASTTSAAGQAGSAADTDLTYKVFYRTADRQFSDSSFVATQDTMIRLMFEVTKPTMLYLKVVAVDSLGNQGLPMYEEVEL